MNRMGRRTCPSYDFALSFAGPDRDVAEALFPALEESELEVFYDKNEQHRIIAEDVEECLRPIYQSEAQFVLVLLGPDYPKRIWTKIESEAFKERLNDGSAIPVWFSDAPPSMFDSTRERGGLDFDRDGNFRQQIVALTNTLLDKLAESR
ncbi:MAG: toll/interleukin-1 receptor domain-containing protein [Phycisphaerae bacterium]|nr:toll/interleukin-1 receptor domain-containing protein [Phycisphaerae bacterium]